MVFYGSIETEDPAHLSTLASSITDYYAENVKRYNLKVIGMKQFYKSLMVGKLRLFENVKKSIEAATMDGSFNSTESPTAMIIADCATNLSKNEKFVDTAMWRNGGMIPVLNAKK